VEEAARGSLRVGLDGRGEPAVVPMHALEPEQGRLTTVTGGEGDRQVEFSVRLHQKYFFRM
jgi:hypothetical protein